MRSEIWPIFFIFIVVWPLMKHQETVIYRLVTKNREFPYFVFHGKKKNLATTRAPMGLELQTPTKKLDLFGQLLPINNTFETLGANPPF